MLFCMYVCKLNTALNWSDDGLTKTVVNRTCQSIHEGAHYTVVGVYINTMNARFLFSFLTNLFQIKSLQVNKEKLFVSMFMCIHAV